MILDALRAISEYSDNKTEKLNTREDISRLSCVLGYEQDVLIMIFDIAVLVTRNS